MSTGRRPKPTAIRRLEGNRGKRAWNRDEPQRPEALPRCPDHLARLIEAAHDLYASRWQVFWRVVLPIIRPGIVAGSILVFIPSLGAYVTPRILGGGRNMMISNLIELQFGQGRNWPLLGGAFGTSAGDSGSHAASLCTRHDAGAG